MCFPLETIKMLLILFVVIAATIAILGILVPFVVSKLGIALGEGWAVLVRCFRILMWALIIIFVIILCFEMLTCLWSFVGGGLHLGR
jgi:ABC-type dipeptide/oligopeptide/nickel transport system permease subunit